MIPFNRNMVALAAVLTLSGCASLGPEPTAAQPADHLVPGQFEYANGVQPARLLQWEELVTDPTLKQLIAQALANNRDLRIAAANVAVAQANLRLQKAAFFPILGASANATFAEHLDGNAALGSQVYSEQASAGLGISAWELDLFGKLRSGKQAALQNYLATEQGERSAKVSLVAGVISSYLQLAADLELLELAKLTASTQKQTLDLTKQYFSVGTGSDLDVSQASAIFHTRNAQAAQSQADVQRDLNALRLLVGGALPQNLTELARLKPFPIQTTQEVNADSSVLLRRPDVLAAERTLLAMNANIAVARAAFFPSISLSGQAGFVSLELSDLFTGAGASGWSFTPSINLPIFNGGRLRANLGAARAQREKALAQYELSIQTAFREVADVLANATFIDAQITSLQGVTEATARALDLSNQRFQAGVDSYLIVLDAQRQDFDGSQKLIQARLFKGQNAVNLFKAMGGWLDSPPATTVPAAVTVTPVADSPQNQN